MKILAIDSTAIVASSAVCEIENGAVGRYCLFTLKNGMTHSENLLPLVDGALTAGGYDLSAIDLIAVSAGPGSFTGVRIGVATVKGLAYSGDKPVCGVSTLDALYRNIAGMAEVICPVMDARRSQVYNAIFKIEGGRPVRMTADRPISLEDLASELRELDSPVFLVGDGAAITAAYLGGNNIAYRAAPENLVWQSAWGVAMAAQDKPFGSADDLLPVYLRLSQAERERQEKLAKT